MPFEVAQCRQLSSYYDSSKLSNVITCFLCSEQGHRAANCPTSKKSNSGVKEKMLSVICYSCGQKSHYSPDYPKKSKKRVEAENHKASKKATNLLK